MPEARIPSSSLVGKRLGRLTVLEALPARHRGDSSRLNCRCECGDIRIHSRSNLSKQAEPMCPNCRVNSRPAKGHSGKHPLFNIWKAMIQRCENPNHTWYARYGGRGIKICPRWRSDFEAFAADMGSRPSLAHTIDRIDGDKDYEPGNVRWAIPTEQQRNRSDTLRLEWEGREISGTEAAQIAGIEVATFYHRLNAGWPMARIMSTPSRSSSNKGRAKNMEGLTLNGITRSVGEWAQITGLTPAAIHQRLHRGWTVERTLTKSPKGIAA